MRVCNKVFLGVCNKGAFAVSIKVKGNNESGKMSIGCKWLQLLLICWESGLFSCTYWFSFTSFLKGSVLHQLITGTDFRSHSCSPQLLFLATSPRQCLQRSRSEHCSACTGVQLGRCCCSPTVDLSFGPPFLSLTQQPLLRMPPRRTLPTSLCLCVWGEGFCWCFCLSRLPLDDVVRLGKKQSGACDSLLRVFVIFKGLFEILTMNRCLYRELLWSA